MGKTNCCRLLTLLIAVVLILANGSGCGQSNEQKLLSGFLQEYSKAVDNYADAASKADTSLLEQAESNVKAFVSGWTDKKIELGGNITPQVLNELDDEYNKITAKYNQLNGKS